MNINKYIYIYIYIYTHPGTLLQNMQHRRPVCRAYETTFSSVGGNHSTRNAWFFSLGFPPRY